MEKITLTYFDFAGSRGEECRLALHLAGVPFVDERLSRAEFDAQKARFPYGAVPVLTVGDKPPLGQSNAILRMVGSLHGLHPSDPWEAAREEGIMAAVEEMRAKMSPIAHIKDPEEKKRARQEAANGYLQAWGGFIERQIGDGPFVGGAELHVADLKIFVALGPFLKGAIDHVPADVWKHFPKLLGVATAVKAHPKIVEWYAKGARG